MQATDQNDFKSQKDEAIKEGTSYVKRAAKEAGDLGSSLKDDVKDIAKSSTQSAQKMISNTEDTVIKGGKAILSAVSSMPYLSALAAVAAIWMITGRRKVN